MNGENNHIFHTSALNDADAEPYVRGLFAVQLWVLAGFAGLSLIAIAALQLFEGVSGNVLQALMIALAGSGLTVAAWRNAAQLLHRAQSELQSSVGASPATDHTPRTSVRIRPAHAHARMTGITPTL
jgi:hypothetical protein